jgi:hypothetical protein
MVGRPSVFVLNVTSFALALLDTITWSGGLILAAAGLSKLRRPRPATRFIAQLSLPATALGVRAVACLELLAGCATLATGSPFALGGAVALYAIFGAALLLHRRRQGEATVSCGCFGTSTAVPLGVHLAALTAIGAATLADAVATRDSLVEVVGATTPAEASVLLVLLALTVSVAVGFSGALAAGAREADSNTFRLIPSTDA